jgi:hypothetical protein
MTLTADKKPAANTMENTVRYSMGDVFGRMMNPSKIVVEMNWAAVPSVVKTRA